MNGMFGPDGHSLCLGRHGARHESRFQRSEWASAEKPRALPWADMNQAVGLARHHQVRSMKMGEMWIEYEERYL